MFWLICEFMKKTKNIFSVEIFVAVLLIAILCGLSARKVLFLRTRARQAIAERNLAALRDALAVYRGDNEGRCPRSLYELAPDYLEKIPPSFNKCSVENGVAAETEKSACADGNGGWLYISDVKDKNYCRVFLNLK